MKDIKPTLTHDGQGYQYIEDSTETKYLLNPKTLSNTQHARKTKPTDTTLTYNFKLVTVRRLTNYSLSDIQSQFDRQQEILEQQAIFSNGIIPYPVNKQVTNLNQYYGVFIDEDINGISSPIHIFYSPSPLIRCYVESTGSGKDDWIVSMCYYLEQITNPDDSTTNKWRLLTVQNKTPDDPLRKVYITDSNALPSCFEYNYGIDSLEYLGGATWCGLGVDPAKRIPVIKNIDQFYANQYITLDKPYRSLGKRRVKAIIYYSFTPTHAFNWHNQALEITSSVTNFNQVLDKNTYRDEGHIKVVRKHNYSLNIPIRQEVENEDNPDLTISSFNKIEYSEGEATYVGNINGIIGSIYQTPDYGTDNRRLSISNYQMKTNVIRNSKRTFLTSDNLFYSFKDLSYTGICSSSFDNRYKLQLDLGEGLGSIDHKYELKEAVGRRGYDYPDFYKYWWVYGKVVNTYHYGDINRYNITKPNGDLFKIGTMFDLPDENGNPGVLKIDDDVKSRVITTWKSRANPQSGFFTLTTGELNFVIEYLNPPLIGHDGVYYYNNQPVAIGRLGAFYDREFESDVAITNANSPFGGTFVSQGTKESSIVDRQNATLMAYSQFLGALGGGAVKSLNIGFVNIAPNDGESVIVRDPTQDMKAELDTNPYYFPNGFWDGDLVDIMLENGKGNIVIYRSDLSIDSTTPL